MKQINIIIKKVFLIRILDVLIALQVNSWYMFLRYNLKLVKYKYRYKNILYSFGKKTENVK